MPQTLDLYARDITGVAKRQRRKTLFKVALAVCLLTLVFTWFTV